MTDLVLPMLRSINNRLEGIELMLKEGLMSVKDVAELLDKNEKTIYRWIKEGKLPSVKIGGSIYIKRKDYLKLL